MLPPSSPRLLLGACLLLAAALMTSSLARATAQLAAGALDAFYEVWHASTRLEWRFLEGLRSP